MDKTNYTLTLKGPISVSDLPISDDVAGRVLRLLTPMGDMSSSAPSDDEFTPRHGVSEGGTKISPKQFMMSKKPTSDIERITCLAFYLTHYKEMTTFKTIDLTHLNIEAAQPRMTNPTVAAKNSVAAQYLVLAGGSKRQIGPRGEAVVNALPDRSKVTVALEEHPIHGRKKTAKKKVKAK